MFIRGLDQRLQRHERHFEIVRVRHVVSLVLTHQFMRVLVMALDGEAGKHRLVHVFADNDDDNEMPAANNGHVVGQAVVNQRGLRNEAKQGREKGVEGLLVRRRAGELLVDLLNGNESVVKRLRGVVGVAVASEMRGSESEGCVCEEIVLSRVLVSLCMGMNGSRAYSASHTYLVGHGCTVQPCLFGLQGKRRGGGRDKLVVEAKIFEGEHGWVGAEGGARGGRRGCRGIGAVEGEAAARGAVRAKLVAFDTASLAIEASHPGFEVAAATERLPAASGTTGGDDRVAGRGATGLAAARRVARVAGRRRRAIGGHGGGLGDARREEC